MVGRLAEDALEGSYLRAFSALGYKVVSWDMQTAIDSQTRLRTAGKLFNRFWPNEAWTIKANRNLLMAIRDARPDILLVFGTAHVQAGALSQVKTVLPECQIVLIWPDSLLYCYSWILSAIPVYDLIATYSRSTIEPFRRLGARYAAWVPLGFDPFLHPPEIEAGGRASTYGDCDASFVGNYTSERERLILRLVADGFRIKVWGPTEWARSSRDRAGLKKYWQGVPLFGREFCLAVKSAPVSLNPINPATYPAANMRFFEIPGCGGVSVSARSPELEPEFPDRTVCYYYDDEDDVATVLRSALDDPQGRKRIATAGQELILQSHTYVNRGQQILALLGLAPSAVSLAKRAIG